MTATYSSATALFYLSSACICVGELKASANRSQVNRAAASAVCSVCVKALSSKAYVDFNGLASVLASFGLKLNVHMSAFFIFCICKYNIYMNALFFIPEN